MLRFLIFTPPFDENNGGVIAFHKLCHVLNQLGRPSELTPYFETIEVSRRRVLKPLLLGLKSEIQMTLHPYGVRRGDFVKPVGRAIRNLVTEGTLYRTNPDFDTPVNFSPGKGAELDDYIVVYSEVVNGNPLDARNVVRWILYEPGGHMGRVNFGTGELIVSFGAGVRRFEIPGSTTLNDELKVVHYPLNLYHPPPDDSPRYGSSYLVRKGAKKNKLLMDHPPDAICIDGLSHREVSSIFRKSKSFISYDPYTAYSIFAALSGCDSVVIPDDGIDEESWMPDPENRYGIAYGWDQLDRARETRPQLHARLIAEENAMIDNVARFASHADSFFGQHK